MAAVQNGANGMVEDGGPRFKPEPSKRLMRFLDIVNLITHLCLGGVAVTVIFLAINFQTDAPLSQHMILCVLGYVILMAQSILVMSPSNGWSRTIRPQDLKIVHVGLHVVGALLAMSGSLIILLDRTPNFTTTHGILGFIALIFTCASLIGGLIHLYGCMNRLTRLIHCFLGGMTMAFAFMALIFGLESLKPQRIAIGVIIIYQGFDIHSVNVLIALTVFGLVGTLLPSCLKLKKGSL